MAQDTQWFRSSKWGVFLHYLAKAKLTAEEWNRQVDGCDVEMLARNLAGSGAHYCFFTVGQNSGHYCAPNQTYDTLTGISPSKCSRRDLISELSAALRPYNIELMVYAASGAPAQDTTAAQKLGWEWGFVGNWPAWGTERTGKRLARFQENWEAVLREWSHSWGKNVRGWWIDGCYFPDEMYRHADAPNFESFVSALRAGNPDAIVAFNPGVETPVISMTEHEDYTAGEIAKAFPVCPGPTVPAPGGKPVLYHTLSYLGQEWGAGEPRFADEFVVGYTRDATNKGGVVTWDVPINPDGSIPRAFLEQLSLLRQI